MPRIIAYLSIGLLIGAIFWWSGSGGSRTGAAAVEKTDLTDRSAIPAPETPPQTEITRAEWPTPRAAGNLMHDPIVVSPCHIVPIQEQEVSSALEGVLKDVLVDLGQHVRPGDLLGRLDDRQIRAEVDLLRIKAQSKTAELIAKAQHDDLDAKITMAGKLRQRDAISETEFKTYFFQRERFAQEMEKGREERTSAQKELQKGLVLLDCHELKSGLDGQVTKVYKRKGETVKTAEPLFRLANFDRLRIEGLCKIQQADLIRVGMPALIEPEFRGEQMTALAGHTGTVTSLTISQDGRLLVSGSEDGTVLLWHWPSGRRDGALKHPAEVYSTALAGPESSTIKSGYRLLTGCADGQARLWLLSEDGLPSPEPPALLTHDAPVRAVAFSRDGSICATGSDDRRIGIWETSTGKHLFWLQDKNDMPAHNGAVTSLYFTPDGLLVSAGRDNTLKLWKLSGERGDLLSTQSGRTGEVTAPGISPDGLNFLFDHGDELRILDRGTGAAVGLVRNPRQERFRTLACFAPRGKLIVALSSSGRIQLWKVPASPEQAAFLREAYAKGLHPRSLAGLLPDAFGIVGQTPSANTLWSLDSFEVRYFLNPGPATVQAAAVAPDESVLFTGGTDKVIRVWTMPAPAQWQHRLEARIVYVGSQVEPGTDMVRIRAEAENPRDPRWRLRAGTQAALRLYPETAPGVTR